MVLRTPFRDRRWLVRGVGWLSCNGGEMLFMRLSKMCVCIQTNECLCKGEQSSLCTCTTTNLYT